MAQVAAMEDLMREKLAADAEVARLSGLLAEAAAAAGALRDTSARHGSAVRDAQAQAAELRSQVRSNQTNKHSTAKSLHRQEGRRCCGAQLIHSCFIIYTHKGAKPAAWRC